MSASSIFDTIAPGLAGDASKAAHIELAEAQTGKVYGDQRDYAVALLAAHTLTQSQKGGTAGAVKSFTEGQFSIGFAVADGSGTLTATNYGTELLRLRRQCIIGARTRAV